MLVFCVSVHDFQPLINISAYKCNIELLKLFLKSEIVCDLLFYKHSNFKSRRYIAKSKKNSECSLSLTNFNFYIEV